MEAFSDGVFAIAITLLVLELGVAATAESDLLGALLDQWPAYLAYVTSFLTIGVIWLEHSTVTSVLRAGDATLFRINLVVLLIAAFLPFPTKLAGDFFGMREPEQVAVVFYGLTLLALDLAMTALARYAIEGRRLVKPGVDDEQLRSLGTPPSLAFYVVAILVSVALPTIGVLLYLAIAVYLGIPGRTLRRVLGRPGGSPTG
jgi:uncharacterized membrane protein